MSGPIQMLVKTNKILPFQAK